MAHHRQEKGQSFFVHKNYRNYFLKKNIGSGASEVGLIYVGTVCPGFKEKDASNLCSDYFRAASAHQRPTSLHVFVRIPRSLDLDVRRLVVV
jgi:hypothetical protein